MGCGTWIYLGRAMIKQRKCKVCKTPFTPYRSFQNWCCPEHGRIIAEEKLRKMERRKDYQRKQALKSKSEWAKEAQSAFNKWVRLRDGNAPCISCGRHHTGQYHAGHYLTVGARPELRFEPLNVWKQCAPCNNHLSGNIVNYRINLIQKIGVEKVEWLEGNHEAKHYTIEDLKAIKAKYTQLARELERGNQ